MKIRVRDVRGISVLEINGKIDINSAEVIEVIAGLLKYSKINIVCNFMRVEGVDYDGLSILAIAYKNVINRKGQMKLCCVPLHVYSLLKTARLDSVFQIYDDEKAALRSFKEPTPAAKRAALRRRFERLDIHIKVKYSLFARPKQVYEGGLSNISGAGIYIHCKKTYPVRTRLNLEIELPDISEPVKVSGAVSWNADKEIQPHDYPGMGVEFTDISYEEQKELLEFIDKNTSSRSGRGRR